MDLGDDGLGQALDASHEGGAAVEKVFEGGGSAVFGLAHRGHLAEVVARAEGFARARQDNHSGLPVFGQCVEFVVQGGQHFVRQRVQPLGCIHAQMGDRPLCRNVKNCHLALPSWSRQRYAEESRENKYGRGDGCRGVGSLHAGGV